LPQSVKKDFIRELEQPKLFDQSFGLSNIVQARSPGEVTFIDLFAGIGGTRMGLEKSGMKCVFSSEWDAHAQEMYRANFGETPFGDITQIDPRTIPDHDVIVAGFPCQPFSISGHKAGFEDTRGTLFFDILKIAKEKNPRVIILENVKHLIHHDSGNTLRVIIESLESLGYFVSWKLLNGKNFGLAQNRERIIIIASKSRAFDFSAIQTKKPRVLREVLDEQGEFEYLEESAYTLLDKEFWRVQKSGLIFVGYRNKDIRKNGVRPGTIHLSRVHKQPNRIYSIDGVHPTLPSQETSGRFWILVDGKVRKLTLREAFRLMGFPEKFKLIGSQANCYLRCGNSVCVPMISAVGKQVMKQFFSAQ
jgi:DNA (cytosine-5)-methyltransferase 1